MSKATPIPVADKALEDFFAYLSEAEFPCGPGERVRACRVYAGADDKERVKRLKTLLCPIFARSREDQLRFYDAYDFFFVRGAAAERPIAERSEKPLPVPAVVLKQSQQNTARFFVGHRGKVAVAFALLVSLGLIAHFNIGTRIRNHWRPITANNGNPSPTDSGRAAPPGASTTKINYDRPCSGLECVTEGSRVPLILSPVGICLLIYVVTCTTRWRRLLLFIREKRRRPPFVWPIVRFLPRISVYQGVLNRTAEAMRLRFASETVDLDLPRTIDSTIHRAGFPNLRFRPRRKVPEYLFLIQQCSPNDHFASWWADVADRLRRLGVEVGVYFYSDDLRRCYPPNRHDSVSTQYLLDTLETQTVVVFGRGCDLLHNFSGEFYSWVDTSLVRRDQRVLMTPRASFEWGPAEHKVAASIPVLPARLENIAAGVGVVERALGLRRESAELPSIPSSYFEEKEEDLGGEPPSLAMFLDPDIFQWLCACAVYPRLEWELTLQLGQVVAQHRPAQVAEAFDGSASAPPNQLFEERNLLQLIRLPWFREGRIPGAWRMWLVKQLQPEVARATHKFILESIKNNRAPQGSFARDQQDLQLAAQQFWLDQKNPEHRLELETAMKSIAGIDVAEDPLLDRLRETWRSDPAQLRWQRLRRTGLPYVAAALLGMLLVSAAVFRMPVQTWREVPNTENTQASIPILPPVPTCDSDRTSSGTLQQIAQIYEQTRQTMSPGDSRTQRMTELIGAARQCAPFVQQAQSSSLFKEFETESDGLRIVALGLAEASPSGTFQLAVDGIRSSRSPFEQYHALILARSLTREISASEKAELRDAINGQIGKTITTGDMSRWQLAEALLNELSGRKPDNKPLLVTSSSTDPPLFQASGGTAPYRWSLKGSLPSGYLFNATSGRITGSCKYPGSSQFVVAVTDAEGAVATASGSIVCAPMDLQPNITLLDASVTKVGIRLSLRYTLFTKCETCFLEATLVSVDQERAKVNDRLKLSPGTYDVGLVIINSTENNFVSDEIAICMVDDQSTNVLFCKSFPFAYKWAPAARGGGLDVDTSTRQSVPAGQGSVGYAKSVCQFYGEAGQRSSAWNKDDSCTIPQVELLDTTYHQTDFECCGGGATSPTTNADVPPGLELRVTGGHYWSVANPKLVHDEFYLHTYCGPEPFPGPSCNVRVDVIAHYRGK